MSVSGRERGANGGARGEAGARLKLGRHLTREKKKNELGVCVFATVFYLSSVIHDLAVNVLAV